MRTILLKILLFCVKFTDGKYVLLFISEALANSQPKTDCGRAPVPPAVGKGLVY